jgi:DNA polymerase (family 10)
MTAQGGEGIATRDFRQVAISLQEIAALLGLGGRERFRVRAYEQAARIVKTLGPDLGRLVEQGELPRLSGIGPALARQIQELWERGDSTYLERLRGEYPAGAAELARIPGMTLKRIRALSAALGIASVAELRSACASGRVRAVPGFGEKTEQRLLEACEVAVEQQPERRPALILSAALELASELAGALHRGPDELQWVGALRRGEELVEELELAVRSDLNGTLRQLERESQIARVDFSKRAAYSTAGVPICLHEAAVDWGNTLVETTGTARHVEALAGRAERRGFSIGTPALTAGPRAELTARRFPGEHDLYEALGLHWVPPELRHGGDELQQAERGSFDDLVQLQDIVGVVHCHTDYSDGQNSILEMARAAQELGMQYITITDHSMSAQYARGVPLSRLYQQWDEISAAQQQVQIQILRGTELDILADGQLDYPDAVLEQFDVLIASIHARHRADRATMSERLVRALSFPLFKIWGHPLGRILNHRDPIDCNLPVVLDALAQSTGAIEINADPHRLDLPPAWIPAARERGIPFVISVDAHSTRGFAALQYGVTMARRGGVRAREVLNALPGPVFARRVKPSSGARAPGHRGCC